MIRIRNLIIMTCSYRKDRLTIYSLVAMLIVLISAGTGHAYTSTLYEDCIKGNGIEKTIERKMTTINILEVSGPVTVNVASNQIQQYVRITGDENILPLVSTIAQGNKLNIFPARPICTDLGITIDISVGNLVALIAAGSGNITVKEINNGRFSLVLSSSGDVDLAGHATLSEVEITGSGDLEASALKTKGTTMHMSGSGFANVHASQALYVDMVGSGDINYFGNPQEVVKEIIGIGSLNRIE
jgi:hypothetical protein